MTVYEVFPDEIKTDMNEIRLEIGQTQAVNVEILPENANNKKYMAFIENDEIAEMQDQDTVAALNEGTTELVIRTENQITTRIPVTVYHIPVETIEIDDSNLKYVYSAFMGNAVDRNGPIDLKAQITPENATYTEIEWESSDPEVIDVSDGKLKIQGTGDVVLTAVSYDGVKDTIELKVVSQNRINGMIVFVITSVGQFCFSVFYQKEKTELGDNITGQEIL